MTGSHAYAVPGDYLAVLTVVDDDDGEGSASRTIEVLSPADAVERVIGILQAKADDESVSAPARDLLVEALEDLEGPLQGAPNQVGALEKFADEDWSAGVRKLGHAIDNLVAAQNADPALDCGLVMLVLAQVGESVAADLTAQAEAALDPPSKGEAKQLQRISSLLADGRTAVAEGRYGDALDAFHEATRRAEGLLA